MRSLILKLLTLLSITLFLPHPSFAETLKSKILVGYWHNFDNGSGFIKLKDVSPDWDVIHVAFAENDPDTFISFTPYGYDSPADFIKDVKLLQAKGKKVSISIGGANSIVKLTTEAERQLFVKAMINIIETYGFDGMDIDLEGASLSLDGGDTDFRNPTTPSITNLISGIREVVNHFDGKLMLTMAPETYYVQVGLVAYAGPAGAYLPLIHALRDILTFLHVQNYNTGGTDALDGQYYAAATADFQVALLDMLLKGFPIARDPTNIFPPLRPDQLVIGLPSAPSAASSGYTAPAEVIKAFDYLALGKTYNGRYKMSGPGYPELRGVMAWSINWDAANHFDFSKTLRTHFDAMEGI